MIFTFTDTLSSNYEERVIVSWLYNHFNWYKLLYYLWLNSLIFYLMKLSLHLLCVTALFNNFFIHLQGLVEVELVKGCYVRVKVVIERLWVLWQFDLWIVFDIFVASPYQLKVFFLNFALLLCIAIELTTFPEVLSLSLFPKPLKCTDRLFPNDTFWSILFFLKWKGAANGHEHVLFLERESVLDHRNDNVDCKWHLYN